MPKSEYMVMGAGALAFGGSFSDTGGFPPNGYTIVAATGALVLVSSLASRGPLEPVVAGLAGLMLLTAAIRYIPGLTVQHIAPVANKTVKPTPSKDKKHG